MLLRKESYHSRLSVIKEGRSHIIIGLSLLRKESYHSRHGALVWPELRNGLFLCQDYIKNIGLSQ